MIGSPDFHRSLSVIAFEPTTRLEISRSETIAVTDPIFVPSTIIGEAIAITDSFAEPITFGSLIRIF